MFLAWVACASAVYLIFGDEWTNVGGSVTWSFSCDVINVDFVSYLEKLPGWSLLVDVELPFPDSLDLGEDVSTVGEFFNASQAEINTSDESFCSAGNVLEAPCEGRLVGTVKTVLVVLVEKGSPHLSEAACTLRAG